MNTPFDLAPYPYTQDGPTTQGYAMDPLHIHLLRRAISLDTGIPPAERVCLEIGSFHGRSTTAFIHALQTRDIGHLHIVEVKLRPPLKRLLAESGVTHRITVHTRPVWELQLTPRVNHLAFVDGDHTWPALADILACLAMDMPLLAMHDSQTLPVGWNCWGSTLAAGILRQHHARHTYEDATPREGMRTWRGFLISSTFDVAPGMNAKGDAPAAIEQP